MSFSTQDIQTLRQAKAEGKTKEQALAMLAQTRTGTTSTPTATAMPTAPEKKPLLNRATDAVLGAGGKVAGFLGLDKATDTFGRAIARTDIGAKITGTDANANREFIEAPTGKELAGAALQTGALVAGTAITGGSSLAGQVAAGATAGYLYDIGNDMLENASIGEVLTPGMGTIVGAAAPVVVRGATAAIGAGARAASKVAGSVADVAPGVAQIGKDLVERAPRAINRVANNIDEAGQKAARLKAATPATQEAIKVKLDDALISGIESADEPTRKAFREIVEVAETPSVGLRPKVRPESVAGNTASTQYDLLEKQRKTVGAEIGKLSDELSKTQQVDILPVQRSLRDVLRQNNILPDNSGQLKFNTKRLTPQQQTVVQRLYELTTSDQNLTPKQIHEFDQLFSKLQREARFKDQVDDIYLNVQTPKGPAEINIFKVFRDIYSRQLDELSPRMRQLNGEYRLVKNLQDDLDASIFKSGNFETTKNLDGAEFAQTNLRRLFSDAQSAADYRAIYDQLDAVSRSLGYTGARADELALFAEKLRKVYPDTVPDTSFRGGIMGALETALEVGKPNAKDQQEALKKLLEEVVQTTP